MNQSLSRAERLRGKREFDRVFAEGRSFRLFEIGVRAVPNGLSHSRVGLSVGRRLGGAVRRNRMKRLLREAYRLNKGFLEVPCDIVMMPRAAWRDLSLGVIGPKVREALCRINETFASK